MQRRALKKITQEPIASVRSSNITRRVLPNRNINKIKSIPPARGLSQRQLEIKNAEVPVGKPVEYSVVPRKFEGETIYIIGGGPSLKNFNFDQLKGLKTIVINKAVFFHQTADVLYWTDSRFYTWYKNDIDNFSGLKFSLKPGSQYTKDIKVLRKGVAHGLEKDPHTLAHGYNSGYAAINLAYHLGANRIVLLGFDMHNTNKDTHFHDGYPTRPAGDHIYRDKFLPGFKELEKDLRTVGVTVFNASTHSQLNTFPKITLAQALSFR
jgi:hypothetical protein